MTPPSLTSSPSHSISSPIYNGWRRISSNNNKENVPKARVSPPCWWWHKARDKPLHPHRINWRSQRLHLADRVHLILSALPAVQIRCRIQMMSHQAHGGVAVVQGDHALRIRREAKHCFWNPPMLPRWLSPPSRRAPGSGKAGWTMSWRPRWWRATTSWPTPVET